MTISHKEVVMPKQTFLNLSKDKQEKVLFAAMDALRHAHYNKITIDQIVKLANIPKGSFYQYFSNKDDLYIYIFSNYGDMKKETLELLKMNPGNIDLKDYLCQLIIHGQDFESELDDDHMLKHKFYKECPQSVKYSIMSEAIPKGISLIKEVLIKYQVIGAIRNDISIDIASYLIVMAIVNLEEYPFVDISDISVAIEDVFQIFVYGISQQGD